MMTQDQEIINLVLLEKYKLLASKKKWFECLQIALNIDDSILKAQTTFKIAINSETYFDRK